MMNIRVIPTILLDNNKSIKTHKFNKIKITYIGDPINITKIFNEKQADEICFIDIFKSAKNEKPNFDLIENIASEFFAPMIYGGGIHTLEDAKKIFHVGVEKIIIESEAYENLEFLKTLNNYFGSQSIIFSLNLKKDFFGRFKIFNTKSNTFLKTNNDEFFSKLNLFHKGEILINFIELENTYLGPDIQGIRFALSKIDKKIIYNCGISSINDIKLLSRISTINGVCVGSLFIFSKKNKGVLINYDNKI